jgi:hypothetical protein
MTGIATILERPVCSGDITPQIPMPNPDPHTIVVTNMNLVYVSVESRALKPESEGPAVPMEVLPGPLDLLRKRVCSEKAGADSTGLGY